MDYGPNNFGTTIAILLMSLMSSLTMAATNSEIKGHCPLIIEDVIQKVIGPAPSQYQMLGTYPQKVWQGHITLANEIWKAYKSNQKNLLSSVFSCLKKPLNKEDLQLALNQIFRDNFIKELEAINPKAFNEILDQHDSAIENLNLIAFDGQSETENGFSNIIDERQAGYNVHSQTIYGDYNKTSSTDWTIILIHELSHKIDDISLHVETFNNKEYQKIIIQSLKQNYLTEEQIKLVDKMLWHGLNIGFLAEYRAWIFTADYLSGSQKEIVYGPYTKWLKDFVKLNVDDRHQAIFRFLNQNFTNRSSAVPWINHPLIQKRLEILRYNCLQEYGYGNNSRTCKP
ncbi:MAG: hypothetical protein ACXVCP_04695 [Bdellovibrio sp.]